MTNGTAIPERNPIHAKTGSAGVFFAAVLALVSWLGVDRVNADQAAAEARVTVAPQPAWVSRLTFARGADTNSIEPGEDERLLLVDRQINGETNEDFVHDVRQLLTASGVQRHSIITVGFDPAYQYLTFHWVRLWRGTNSFNRLDRDKIKVIQPERELEDYLLTGEEDAVLALDDVRPGDILDYAYTVRDETLGPKGGRFSDEVLVQAYEPIQRLRTRLVWPAQRLLYITNHRTDTHPVKSQRNGLIEFIWNFTNVPALHWEPPLPQAFEPRPWIQLSGFQSWSEVNRWALNAFSNAAPLSPDLTRQIAQWRRIVSREEQVLTALRFVQDQVRYLGVESGLGGYVPSAPSAVFARRFGDCKDKTLLFVTILRALGIQAYPELVNTRRRGAIEHWHPAAVFNHAIAEVVLPGQGTYWLDPTASYERGPLAIRSWRDYGFGLVLRRDTTALSAIPPPPILPKTTVTEFWRIGRLGRPAELRVVTLAEGDDAVALRARFATTRREDIEREKLNAYAADYPAIVQTRPLVVTDDEEQNQVQVTEYYLVERLWDRSAVDFEYRCRFYSRNVGSAIEMPAVLLRTMPLGVPYPRHEIYRAEIELRVPIYAVWSENRAIDNPAFSFHRTAVQTENRVTFACEFATLTDSVPPEAMPHYARQLGQVIESLGFSLYAP